MIRVNVIVEGQSERSFVHGPMAEIFWPLQIGLAAIVLGSSGHKGGNTNFDRVQLNVLTCALQLIHRLRKTLVADSDCMQRLDEE